MSLFPRKSGGVTEEKQLSELTSASNRVSNVGQQAPYSKNVDAGADGTVAPIRVTGTESIFNPFNVFRYSRFAKATVGVNGTENNPGSNNLSRYVLKYEKGAVLGENVNVRDEQRIRNQDRVLNHNPSARSLVDWANSQASARREDTGNIFPYPYSITDFLWCKYYGKIPNNRLITLRRYPVPVEDNLMVSRNSPLVPIAQAVTWFGEGTGNSLSEILGMTWGLKWKEAAAEVQDVDGNEIQADAIADVLGVKEDNTTLRTAIKIAIGQAQNPGLAASGKDEQLQDYDKASYGPNGPYWNRVLGPVNIINSTQQRDQGLEFSLGTKGVSVDFEYVLRTWSGADPKMAFLDLLTNFLSLTYNTAPFWGGAIRYFQQTGFLAPGFNTDAFDSGDNITGLKEMLLTSGSAVLGAADELKKFMDSALKEIEKVMFEGKGASGDILELIQDTRLAQILGGVRSKPLQQKPLLMRAMLDGRAVGEWHLMIGNPLEPIAVIGNLCLDSCTFSFGEELGEDGFPTSMKFSVSLTPGRPRAKQDIESMFNLGGGPLSHTPLAQPSSAFNSFGENNSLRANSYMGSDVYATTDGGATPAPSEPKKPDPNQPNGNGTPVNGKQPESVATAGNKTASRAVADNAVPVEASNLADYFRPAVSRAYGESFGNSKILPLYFYNRMTKD